jgi:hypothetical protein
LTYVTHSLAILSQLKLLDVDSINEDLTSVRVIESLKELDYGTLARA